MKNLNDLVRKALYDNGILEETSYGNVGYYLRVLRNDDGTFEIGSTIDEYETVFSVSIGDWADEYENPYDWERDGDPHFECIIDEFVEQIEDYYKA